MSTHRLLSAVGLTVIALALSGIMAPNQLSGSASGQGFYFESWGGGYGAGGRLRLGIGVRPSSPMPYGVRPSGIFPPLGFPGTGRIAGSAVPFGYRDYRGDVYDRLYRQYRAQLDLPYRYGVRPLLPTDVYGYPERSAVPPVVPIQPFSDQDYGGGAASEHPQPSPVPVEEIPQWLRSAAERLSLALARRGEEGEIWREYLAPDVIIQAIDEGTDPRELGQLLLNYDGVVTNGQLRWVMRSDGFVDTRHWLRRYIETASDRQAVQQQEPDSSRSPLPPPHPSPPQAVEEPEANAAEPAADEPVPVPSGVSL